MGETAPTFALPPKDPSLSLMIAMERVGWPHGAWLGANDGIVSMDRLMNDVVAFVKKI